MKPAASESEPLARTRAGLLLVDDDPLITETLSFALGAWEFVAKPAEPELLKRLLTRALETPTAAEADLVGESPALLKLKSQIAQFAPAPYPVLIEGESGSGKEFAARSLHRLSARAARPYLTVNCAAIAPALVEPTLFGYAKGAFTAATSNKAGCFEDA